MKSRFMLLTLDALLELVTKTHADCLAGALLGCSDAPLAAFLERSTRRWPHSWSGRRGAGRTLGVAYTTLRFMLLTLAPLFELVPETHAECVAGALLGRSGAPLAALLERPTRRWPQYWSGQHDVLIHVVDAGRTLRACAGNAR